MSKQTLDSDDTFTKDKHHDDKTILHSIWIHAGNVCILTQIYENRRN